MSFIIKPQKYPTGYVEFYRLYYDGKYISNRHWACEIEMFKNYFIVLDEKLNNKKISFDKPFKWDEEVYCEELIDIEKVIKDIEKGVIINDTKIIIDDYHHYYDDINKMIFIIQERYQFLIDTLTDDCNIYYSDNHLNIFDDNDKFVFTLMILAEPQDNLKKALKDCSKYTV